MIPHPTKTDTWIPGERNKGDNLCMEIPIGDVYECTLGKPELVKLSHNHLIQIKSELWERGGGPEGKIINSLYSGASPDQLLSKTEIDDFADRMIWFYGDAKKASHQIDLFMDERDKARVDTEIPYEMPPKRPTLEVYQETSLDWKVQIYNKVVESFGGEPSTYLQGAEKDTMLPEPFAEEFAQVVIKEHGNDAQLAAAVLKEYITEHITVMSGMMMHQSMKEEGLMENVTKATDALIKKVNEKGEANAELDAALKQAAVPVEPSTNSVKQSLSKITRKAKKKGAKRRHHLSMSDKSTKRILGASLLHRLGTVQQNHLTATKKALLKEIPMADLVEVSTGEKLPDYQANLINGFQAKADPYAPVTKRMGDQSDLVDTNGAVEVQFIGGGQGTSEMRDIRITQGENNWLIHYENVRQAVAAELDTTTEFVDKYLQDPEYYVHVKDVIEKDLPEVIKEFAAEYELTDEALKAGVEQFVEVYSIGYVRGIVDSLHVIAGKQANPGTADLGL